MVLKLVVILLIAYWIVRAAVNLWRAAARDARADARSSARIEEDDIRREVRGVRYEQTWHVPSQGRGQRREEEVEDARWRDVG